MLAFNLANAISRTCTYPIFGFSRTSGGPHFLANATISTEKLSDNLNGRELEEKLDENATLPCLASFRRRKREAEHADGFFAGVHAEFGHQG